MSHAGYDSLGQEPLKAAGNRLHEALRENSHKDGWEASDYSRRVLTRALGFMPYDSGPNMLTSEEIRAAIPRIEGMLAIVEAINAETDRSDTQTTSWKKFFRRFV